MASTFLEFSYLLYFMCNESGIITLFFKSGNKNVAQLSTPLLNVDRENSVAIPDGFKEMSAFVN